MSPPAYAMLTSNIQSLHHRQLVVHWLCLATGPGSVELSAVQPSIGQQVVTIIITQMMQSVRINYHKGHLHMVTSPL